MIARSLALVPLVAAAAAAALPRPPIDPAAAARAFREAQIVSRADGGALWGHPLWERMVFIDAGAGRIAASEAVPGLELEESGGVWLGALPDDLGAANTAQDWRGEVWTSVLWPLPGGEASRLRLLGHEMYHRVQRELPSCPLPPRPCDHLDTEVGRLWLRLEWRALADALRTTGEPRRTAVADALLFRAARYELLPGARDAEVALESNEGVAEATGYFVLRLSSEKRAAALAARLAEDERQEHFARGFAYTSGPAGAALLEDALRAARPDDPRRALWNVEFDGTLDLAVALATAYALPGVEGSALEAADERATVYGGDALRAEERRRAAARRGRHAELRALLVDGPVLELTPGADFGFTFDPLGVESLAGLGQVHRSLTVTDTWGRLEVSGGPALLLTDEAGMIRGVRVAIGDGAETGEASGELAGDGWRLELTEGWRAVDGSRSGDRTVSGR